MSIWVTWAWAPAVFNQNGGTNTISGSLSLATSSGSASTYRLAGNGQLSAASEIIGDWSAGTFTQDGGTNTVSGDLYLGRDSANGGTYTLNSGQLSLTGAYSIEHVGYSGYGTFTQTGGTNSAWGLELGGANSSYNFKGGTLIIQSLNAGAFGAAFNFGGGTLQAGGNFSTSMPMTLTGNGGDADVDTAGNTVTLSGKLIWLGRT